MKKTLTVTLALIIALTLVIGSVGTVSAEKPNKTMEVTIYGVYNVPPDSARISFQYKWEGYNMAFGYSVTIINDTTNSDIAELGQIFDRRITWATFGTGYPIANTSDKYTITLTLLRKNGSTIDSTSDTWTP